MPDRDDQLQAARAAKARVRELFGELARITGIGVTQRDGVYCVKVNLAEPPEPDAELPESIDGVPVVLHVTGPIRKQTG